MADHSGAALLKVAAIVKTYDNHLALRGVSLDVAVGAIVCLLGPSGCGKTTLLRVIAGLEQADSGELYFENRRINPVPPHLRGFGLMFQEYALFPHLDVAANIAFGLRMQQLPHDQITARVAAMLELVGLAGYGRRRVYELSGGERQRVALARSLAPNPRLLMLDEPLGALDRALRERLLDELHAIIKRVGVTSIYVTHDQAEAFAIADWLVVMNAGMIEQNGPPEEVYRRPATLFIARFLGLNNLVAGRVLHNGAITLLETALGRLGVAGGTMIQPGTQAMLVIRPEAARLPNIEAQTNLISGIVEQRSFRGSRTRMTLRHASGQLLEFDLDTPGLPTTGESITLELRPDGISLIL